MVERLQATAYACTITHFSLAEQNCIIHWYLKKQPRGSPETLEPEVGRLEAAGSLIAWLFSRGGRFLSEPSSWERLYSQCLSQMEASREEIAVSHCSPLRRNDATVWAIQRLVGGVWYEHTSVLKIGWGWIQLGQPILLNAWLFFWGLTGLQTI